LTIDDLRKLFPKDNRALLMGIKYSLVVKDKLFPFYNLLKEVVGHKHGGLLMLLLLRCAMTAFFAPRWAIHALRGNGRRFACETMRTWAKAECRIARIRLHVHDRNSYDSRKAYLFVANHQSPMDIPVIYSLLRVQAGFIANADFKRIPVFNFWMREVGGVFVRQGTTVLDIKALKRIVSSLKKGNSLIIFPEAGMSYDGTIQPFSRAGLAVAIMGKALIVPVGISGTPDAMPPGEFYVLPGKPVAVRFGSPIDPSGLTRADRVGLAASVRERIIELKFAGDEFIARKRPDARR
jgi:1-acyl-sn-glycerol-3-phosphate acyltransferase